MKTWLSVLAAAAMIVACDGATAPSSFKSTVDDSQVPAVLRAAYREDAARLALRDLLASGYAEIPIPDEAVLPYYDALVLVYNATVLPARDTVVDVYQIHTFPMPVTRSLLMVVAGDQEWAQRLVHGEVPTGSAEVDGLLDAYALSLDRGHTLTTGELLIVLRSGVALNVAALAPRFVGVPGVHSSQPNGAVGDGSDTRGSTDQSRVLLDYSVGYGDCPAGCIGRRFYHFAAHADGTVEYLGASGGGPPEPPPQP
jgi:hypothetical protein